MGRKKAVTAESIRRQAIGLLDNRSTDNDGMLIKRDQKVSMIDIFGTEQKTVVAYFVSDLLAKGFNNQQIIVAIEKKFGLKWSIQKVTIMKELLHKMWRCEMAHTMNDQIAREVATIDTQIKEAWEAWEMSKRGIKHKQTRNTNSASPAQMMDYRVEEHITDETTSPGDVKFLQHIGELGKEKRKLLGLYAPEKRESGGPQTAVQFNIVGDGAGGEITSLMQTIMQGAVSPQAAPQQVEEAQVVPVEQPADESTEAIVEKLYKEVVGDEF